MAVHDDWPRAGVPANCELPTRLHVLRAGLLRWAMLLGRVAAAGVLVDLLGPLARWLADKARYLQEVIAALDGAFGDSWRTVPFIMETGCADA